MSRSHKGPFLKHPGRELPAFQAQLESVVPPELRSRTQWINWILGARGSNGKLTKVPISSTREGPVSVTNPESWRSFDRAVSRLRDGNVFGIGFVFAASDPFVGIDLDGCRDAKTCEIEPRALRIVEMLMSYTEISQSGRGLHIIGKANLEGLAGNRKGRFEIYDRNRYFTMNGAVLSGYSEIREIQDEIDALHAEIFGASRQTPVGTDIPHPSQPVLSDEEVIRQLLGQRR